MKLVYFVISKAVASWKKLVWGFVNCISQLAKQKFVFFSTGCHETVNGGGCEETGRGQSTLRLGHSRTIKFFHRKLYFFLFRFRQTWTGCQRISLNVLGISASPRRSVTPSRWAVTFSRLVGSKWYAKFSWLTLNRGAMSGPWSVQIDQWFLTCLCSANP